MSKDELLCAEIRFLEEANAGLREALDAVGRLEEERQAELGQIEIDHRAELEALRVAQVVGLGAIEESRQADLGAMAIAHREATEAAEARHRGEIDRLYAEHLFEVAGLRGALAEARGDADRAVEECFAAMEQARAEAQRALAVATTEHAAERRRELAALAMEHAAALAAERSAFEQMISAQEGDIAQLTTRTHELEAALASARQGEVPEAEPAAPRLSPFEVAPRPSVRPTRAAPVYGSIADALRAIAASHDEGD